MYTTRQLVPQDFNFLDLYSDPQKYPDPRIRIQGVLYQPKTENNFFTPKTQILTWKKERL